MDWINQLREAGDSAARLRTDLEFFASRNLQIRPKAGKLEPFTFNPAQRELHRMLEQQRAEKGRVRAIVLKARQLGVSTYVAARFYHKTINGPGQRTNITGHEKRASTNLFQLVKRFHEHMPDDNRPSIGTSNAEELIFDKIDSGYLVSVATAEGAGRSSTSQNMHASEAAFWVNLQTQLAALIQTVPDIDDTEIIIETTANGYNDFHALWRKAEAGNSEFMPVFLPWSIDPAYRAKLPDDFQMTAEESALAELHGLDAEQICWRRNKLSQLGDENLFCQEYPLTPSEAFIASDFDSFIKPELVLRARKERIEPHGPLILGVDPAGRGADKTAIAFRRGHSIFRIDRRHGLDTMQVTGWVAALIREHSPARVNIDVGGLGIGIYDRLIEQGYPTAQVNAVNFGGKPIEPPPLDETGKPGGGPANRRAELWLNMKNALEGRFAIPDSDSLQGDLISVGYRYSSDGKLLLESKEDMRKRGVPSPDEGDAAALCFTEPNGSPIPRNAWFNRKLEYPGEAYV